jgi:preprotein translocase subunit YajC
MTGFRTDKHRVEVFKPKERVVTLSGRRGTVKSISPDGELAIVRWDDEEEFSIRTSHLHHEERFFGGESSHRPGT